MSLSNPQLKNPAQRFIQWRGAEDGGGRLTWYDKANQTDVEIKLPFNFTVLDELNTVTGFSERDHSGFWSNEVRNMQNEELVVKTKAGTKARGLYANISADIKSQGAKYAKSVYIAFKDEETQELVIGNIKLSGSSLTPWIEFQKQFDVSQCAVQITDTPKKGKKGSNTYFMPEFEGLNLGAETKKAAIRLDEELQRYLNTYFSRPVDSSDSEIVEDEDDDVETENTDVVVTPPADEAPKKTAEPTKPSNLKDVEF